MKKFFFSLLIFFPALGFSQAPDLMSYQTVVWDTGNNLVTNSLVGFQFSILQGTTTGPSVYVETHGVTTNANGLATLEIGNGAVVSGDIATIDWSNGPYFFKTETDPMGGATYTITGTSQFLSVPYALYANVADSVVNDMVDDADADPTNELNTSAALVGTDLNISDNGGTLTVDLSSLVGSGGNPTDELNTAMVLNGNDLELTDAGGTLVVDLTSLVDDADADPNNEIQTISQVGNLLTLSNGGGSVTVSSLDDDPTNEFQDLSFSNDTVYISDGTETYVGPETVIAPVLIAPWVNFGLGYTDAGYYKHGDRVYLQGLVNGALVGSILFNLPAGYRPTSIILFSVSANAASGRIDVLANGNVVYQSGPAGGFVSLDGLSFRISN